MREKAPGGEEGSEAYNQMVDRILDSIPDSSVNPVSDELLQKQDVDQSDMDRDTGRYGEEIVIDDLEAKRIERMRERNRSASERERARSRYNDLVTLRRQAT